MNYVKDEFIHVKEEKYLNTDSHLEEEGNDSEEDEDLSTVVKV